MEFTEEQIQRYSRQIILEEVGGKGQKKLNDANVPDRRCGWLGFSDRAVFGRRGNRHHRLD